MSGYVSVCSDESQSHDAIELPAEMDGTLLLSILQSQFDGATGLKYRNQTTKAWRAIKVSDGVLYPPESGWGENVYVVVSVKAGESPDDPPTDSGKRKMDAADIPEAERAAKNPRRSKSPESRISSMSGMMGAVGGEHTNEDMIVLGLEWSVGDAELRKYFEQFGSVRTAEVKKDMTTGRSRGFGFVRFFDPTIQSEVYAKKHIINGRRVDLSYSRKSSSFFPCKVFVGCMPLKDEVTTDDLRDYFGRFGLLSDVYIPKPYRGFGFVTFQDGQVAMKVMSNKHQIKGSVLNLTVAEPKVSGATVTHAKPASMMVPSSHVPNTAYFYDPTSQYMYPVAATTSYVSAPQEGGAGGAGGYSHQHQAHHHIAVPQQSTSSSMTGHSSPSLKSYIQEATYYSSQGSGSGTGNSRPQHGYETGYDGRGGERGGRGYKLEQQSHYEGGRW